MRPKTIPMLHQLLDCAAGCGQAVGRVVDVAVYGTRRKPPVNAGDEIHRGAASGRGPHSVFEGPAHVPGGAPVLRREKIA